MTTIYLLFNEGYYSVSQHTTLRRELCVEAMRLCTMLIENKNTNQPSVNALLSLMCFHASRFDAREDENGDPVLYEDQDESLWNAELISKGGYFLRCSATGTCVSKYHLEATIAYWSTQKKDTNEKWETVLQLYDQLLEIEYSPVAALNRIYVLSKVKGKANAIAEAEKLNLSGNPFYFLLLGDLYMDVNSAMARQQFQKALILAKTETARRSILKKMDNIPG